MSDDQSASLPKPESGEVPASTPPASGVKPKTGPLPPEPPQPTTSAGAESAVVPPVTKAKTAPLPPEPPKPASPAAADSAAPVPAKPKTGALPPEPPRPQAPASAGTTPSTLSISAKPDAPSPPPAAQPTPAPRCAIVIDDEPANRDFLVRLLQQAGYTVQGASSGSEGLKIAAGMEAALVVIDNKLPDMDGVELLIQLRKRYPTARMIMATMLDERALMAKAFENGCDVFMVKPHGFMELFRRLQSTEPIEEKLNRLIIDQYGPRPYRG